MDEVQEIITGLYKENSSKLLSVLVRILGAHNFDMAEDVLQEAFNRALIHWKKGGVPDNPSAWLVRTAKHHAIDVIRSHRTKRKFARDLSHHMESEWSLTQTIDQEFQDHKIKDDQLRMIFLCCREDIKIENRIPFILKSLCGLSIPAISRALLIPEATVKKRLLRTREKFRDSTFGLPEENELADAMNTVHTVIYLLFNEGFCSTDKKKASKVELCQEALALTRLLVEDLKMANRETFSLFALMHFHIARLDARFEASGHLIPIDLQDRSLWKKEYISMANAILNMIGAKFTDGHGRFYYEAHIAKEHCRAESFETTDWTVIVELYDKLVKQSASPLFRLNQAVAIGYAGNIELAITKVEALVDNKALKNSYMLLATLAHLHAKAGNTGQAYKFAEKSKAEGGAPYEHQLMMQQIERLLQNKIG